MTPAPVRQLLVARDVMSKPPICVHPDATVREVAKILEENEISGLPVVDEQERPLGVISRTDLLRGILEGAPGRRPDESFLELLSADEASPFSIDFEEFGPADEWMTPDPVTAPLDAPLAALARAMTEERVHRVVVVDRDGRVAGMVTTLDLLAHFPS